VSCSNAPVSGTESDSDSGLTPAPEHTASSSAPPPLSAIAERRRAGEDTEDDEEDTGAWRTADVPRTAGDSDLRAGYLWKKGERRKVRHLQRSQMPSHDVANTMMCSFLSCYLFFPPCDTNRPGSGGGSSCVLRTWLTTRIRPNISCTGFSTCRMYIRARPLRSSGVRTRLES
jgi:hypothetical protein